MIAVITMLALGTDIAHWQETAEYRWQVATSWFHSKVQTQPIPERNQETSPSSSIVGKVIKVTDGDTITIRSNGEEMRVRLSGIDAPESDQPFGRQSTKKLSSIVKRKEVRVETNKTDRYGRVLGKIWVQPSDCSDCGKTLDVNHAQVLSGMAWWYRQYANEQSPEDRGRYESAEDEARKRGWGLWADTNPIAPWDWRRGSRTQLGSECGSRRYCREMRDCAEAKFYLNQCGLTRLDGDSDGVPCESLCKR
ncbi:MAG: thermonuclease family protein [Pseudomonadales bacterium]|nr:thermonuclease family protein [Pseudomonadales bacterium]